MTSKQGRRRICFLDARRHTPIGVALRSEKNGPGLGQAGERKEFGVLATKDLTGAEKARLATPRSIPVRFLLMRVATYLGKDLVNETARIGAFAQVNHDVGESNCARPIEAEEAERLSCLDGAEYMRQRVRRKMSRLRYTMRACQRTLDPPRSTRGRARGRP